MQRDEIDVMWQQALHDSVRDGEQFTRYHFAEMVAAKERARVEMLEMEVKALEEKITDLRNRLNAIQLEQEVRDGER